MLPDAFARDSDRRTRFAREARLLASLNHPGIATLHDYLELDGKHCLLMELVEGETLAERIERGALSIDSALGLFRQIAEGLDAAHEHGIVHRDLKPANIKITPDGKIKILDFGLGKTIEHPGASGVQSDSPTMTRSPSEAGVILGTAPYMSPEQASGKAVDKRTDIWAFGCCLYEALSGKRAFGGETVTVTRARILEREPDWDALPGSIPPDVRALIERCLQKDRNARLRDIGDAFHQAPAEESSPGARRWIGWAVAAVLGLALLTLLVRSGAESEPRPVTRFVVDEMARKTELALSPDGSRLVYDDREGGPLRMREMTASEPTRLAGTEGALRPFFSPDGNWVGFFSPAGLKKVPLRGGQPATIMTDVGNGVIYRGVSWSTDGWIYYAGQSTLYRISENGGDIEPVGLPEANKGERSIRWPRALPDGKGLLLVVAMSDTTSFDDALIVVQSKPGEEYKVLVEGGSYPRYSPSGHLVYARAGEVLAAPFDLERLELTGQAMTVQREVWTDYADGDAGFDVSESGTFAFASGGRVGFRTKPVWVDRSGAVEELTAAYAVDRVAISPDGRYVAFDVEAAKGDIWIYDIERETMSRLTHEWGNNRPVWTPDSSRIVYASRRGGIDVPRTLFSQIFDGSSAADVLYQHEGPLHPGSWGPDAAEFLFDQSSEHGDSDLWMLSMKTRTARPVLVAPQLQGHASLSSDGKWLAYLSEESGQPQIYVQPYPAMDSKKQISSEGGSNPKWGPHGDELFYQELQSGSIMAVEIQTAPAFRASRPRRLFSGDFYHGFPVEQGTYDVSPDGERFLMIEWDDPLPPARIEIVLNFAEELKRLVPPVP